MNNGHSLKCFDFCKPKIAKHANVPVTCKPGLYGAGDSWAIAGFKFHVLTSASSQQCRVTEGFLIPSFNTREIFTLTCQDVSGALIGV